MPVKTISTGRALMGGSTYADRVRAAGPIAYWPLWETAGAVARDLVNSPAQDGTYGGPPTLNNIVGPDGVNGAPFFDGVNDYVNAQSAAFTAAWSGVTGSCILWCRVANVGAWTDGSNRVSYRPQVDAANYLYLRKAALNNQFQWSMQGGGVGGTTSRLAMTETGWFCAGATWGGGFMIAYYNGLPEGAPTAIGVWAGALAQNVIGASSIAPAAPWHGWLAHCAVFDRALSPGQMLDLATV